MRQINLLPLLLGVCTAALSSQLEGMEIESTDLSVNNSPVLVPSTIKDLKKQAWKKAKAGDFKTAESYLVTAVEKGSRHAALFLAREYEKGNLLTSLDTEKATHYKEIYNSLKPRGKSKWEYDRTSIDINKATTKRREIKAFKLGRELPWFGEALKLVQQFSYLPTRDLKSEPILDKLIYLLTCENKKITPEEIQHIFVTVKAGLTDLQRPKRRYDYIVHLLERQNLSSNIALGLLEIVEDNPEYNDQAVALRKAVETNIIIQQTLWYQGIMMFLWEKGTFYSRCSPLSSLRGMLSLLGGVWDNLTPADKELAITNFNAGIKHLNSQELYSLVFEKLLNGNSAIELNKHLLTLALESPYHLSQEKASLRTIVEEKIAIQQSTWFQEISKILTIKSPDYSKRTPLSSMKEMLVLLVHKWIKFKPEEREKAIQYFSDGINHLNSPELYNDIFEDIANGVGGVDLTQHLLTIAFKSPYHLESEKVEIKKTSERILLSLETSWFHEMTTLLNIGNNYKNRKYTPAEAIKNIATHFLVQKYTSEEKTHFLELLKTGLLQLKSKAVYQDILDMIIKECSNSEPQCLFDFIQFIESDLTFFDHNKEKIGEAYRKILWECYDHYWWLRDSSEKKEERKTYEEALIKSFSLAYRYNTEKTAKNAKHIAKRLTKDYVNPFSLQFLLAIKTVDPLLFEELFFALNKKMDDIIKIVLEDKTVAAQTEGTPLSLDNIMSLVMKTLSRQCQDDNDRAKSNAARAFYIFTQRGSEHFLTFENLLVEHLPKVLLYHPSKVNDCLAFLVNAYAPLNDSIFQIFIRFFTEPHYQSDSGYWQKRLANDIFVNKSDYISQKTAPFYNELYRIFKDANAVYALQKLWVFRQSKGEGAEDLFFQFNNYFTPGTAINYVAYKGVTLPTILDNIISCCIQKNSLPVTKLHEFCQIAEKTKFIEFLSPAIRLRLDNLVLWDEGYPLKQRSQAFYNYLKTCVSEMTLREFQDQFSKTLPESPFKTYGELVFKLNFLKEQTTYECYGTKRQLVEHQKAYPEIEMPHHFKDLYNAHVRYSPEYWSDLHFDLDAHFRNLIVEADGTIYGYICESNRLDYQGYQSYDLYCCDGESGYANWSIPIKSKSQRKAPQFTIGQEKLYILGDHNRVIVLDKRTGNYEGNFTCNVKDLPIKYISTTTNNHLFMVHKFEPKEWSEPEKAYLTGLNLENMETTFTLEIPETKGKYRFYTKGHYFASTGSDSSILSFFDILGTRCHVNGDPKVGKKKHFKHQPTWTIVNNSVIFDEKVAKNTYQLKSHNLVTDQQEWAIQLDNSLADSPAISLDKEKAFLLTKNRKLIAISLAPANSGQKLWETSEERDDFRREAITHLQVSGDGQFVYGLNEHLGYFYRFNVTTGDAEDLGKIEVGGSKYLIGTAPSGRVYVRTH